MKRASVYTKTGDQGTTGLVGGTRIKKNDSRLHLYGELDELNSFIGLALSELRDDINRVSSPEYVAILEDQIIFLHSIQASLFDLGSNLACELENRKKFNLPILTENFVKSIEGHIDQLDVLLPELKNFVLPGGLKSASAFHVARTVCRRVERQLVDFNDHHQAGEVPAFSIEFLNRLSDYFFILARFINFSVRLEEILWKPKR